MKVIDMTEINRDEWRIKRLTRKLTQTEISKVIGCTSQLITMWESGGYMAEDKVQSYMDYIEAHDNRKKK